MLYWIYMNSSEREVVITGVNGFVGEHLARHLKTQGYIVRGVGREQAPHDRVTNFMDNYQVCDLFDKASTKDIVLKEAFAIIHLAGLASVGDSFKRPDLYIKGNATMTDNLLSSALEQGFNGRVVVVSTGAVYNSDQPSPFSEDSTIGGSSPYATGKIQAEHVAHEYAKKGLSVVIARPFNHIGPGQGPGFLLPDIYHQIIEALQGKDATISVGNLKSRRDFTDVRDVAKAYELLASAPSLAHSVYNISSGNSYSGEEILEELSRVMAITVKTTIDQSKVRPTDTAEIIGNSSRMNKELQWTPSIPLSQTIADFVEREEV